MTPYREEVHLTKLASVCAPFCHILIRELSLYVLTSSERVYIQVQVGLPLFPNLPLSIILFAGAPLISLIILTSHRLNLTSLASAMSASDTSDSNVHVRAPVVPDSSGVIPTSTDARAKRRIAALEEELDTLRQEKGTKQRSVYCLACSVLVMLTHH
jgi:hypothetical protein